MQTHATGVILKYALDSTQFGGLGLRKCKWTCNSLNIKSQVASQRMGFKFEGFTRYDIVLPPGKEGARGEWELSSRIETLGRLGNELMSIFTWSDGRPGDREELRGKDTWQGSVLWDEWEHWGRKHVERLMARRE